MVLLTKITAQVLDIYFCRKLKKVGVFESFFLKKYTSMCLFRRIILVTSHSKTDTTS